MTKTEFIEKLKEFKKRLPCELCANYDSDTQKCDLGNNPEVDNDAEQGCWDFL